MSFYEWRRFYFFELNKAKDDGKIAELLNDSEIVVATSGNNNLVIGDSLGQVHLIPRSWLVTTFRAYEVRITHAQQFRNNPYLITIGEDEMGVNPLIKVWDTSRIDKNGIPYCTRVSRTNPNNRAVEPSVFCVHENMQLMAVGFQDGSLLLYRGDVTRERGCRQKMLRENSSCVTGLAFKSTANTSLLYVATENIIYIYNITHKDKEVMSMLDNQGSSKRCCVLADSLMESHFMIARNDAVYCYTSDGKGPCYAVDGEKVMLHWFRTYLIIISKSSRLTPTTATAPAQQPTNNHQNQGSQGKPAASNGHVITVLDIQNKFIVFSAHLNEIKAVLNEWGGLYIIDTSNAMYHLNEKDIQSKLSRLFKKNLYDVAIRMAKSQQYDSDGLVDIFRQYGDHLYAKGDHAGAMRQYERTIGKLEPSYVIRKYMDAKHIDELTSYLQVLHKRGHGSEDHTTLLLNCFTKLNKTDSLKEFIMQKDRELDFDVDIAIKVCRLSSPDEALQLARKHSKHDWYIKIQLEDRKRYEDVIQYMRQLDFEDAQFYMRRYGNILIANADDESTQFLKQLCTGGFGADAEETNQKANAEDFVHLFLNNSRRLVEFLGHLIENGCTLSSNVYDTLLEHYLQVWHTLSGAEGEQCARKVLKLMQNPDVRYDQHQALVVCHMHEFSEGILYLYEEQKLYEQILRYHMARKDTRKVLGCCRRFGHQEPTLWVQALWSCVRDADSAIAEEILPEVLGVISKERLLPPQMVLEAMGTGKSDIKLSLIKAYVYSEYKKDSEIIQNDSELSEKYRKDTDELKNKLEGLKSGPVLIQGSRCAACHHPLELPSLHFLCQHSYHQHCFQSYADNENECVACLADNRKVLELLRAREYNKDLHETFHSQLEKATDAFSLAAEYFGRGVVHTIKVITDKPKRTVLPEMKPEMKPVMKTEATAEGRMRLSENIKSAAVPVQLSEGRLRLLENKFSSSLEANIVYPKEEPKKKAIVSNNPFDNDDDDEDGADSKGKPYDKSLDPFADSDADDDDVDGYDKNLNPFAA